MTAQYFVLGAILMILGVILLLGSVHVVVGAIRVRKTALTTFSLLTCLALVVMGGNARGDLVNTIPATVLCGGDDFTGVEKMGTVTDKAGDVFTLQCVNRDYFQGMIFVKATGKTTDFGRCVFVNGANFVNYETDAKNNFTGIEWVNVKPPENTAASRAMVQANINNNAGASTADWLKKVEKYLKDNNLEGDANNRIYQFPFSPNDQQIDVFKNDTLVTEYVLTPDQANASYLPDGKSPIAPLVIDPEMTVPGLSTQETTGVPEPGTICLLALGLAGISAFRRRMR